MEPHTGLEALDWAVIALYGIFMIGVGAFYSRRQTSTEEYFLGSRSMNSFVVGISMFATLLSTISYLAVPGEMIKHGPVILWGLAAFPVTYVIVGYLLIPRITRLRITSAYELLEDRLGHGVRLLGVVLFMLVRLVWMALLIYLASKALVTVVDWPQTAVPYVVIQRYLTTRNPATARRSFLVNGFAEILITALLGIVGFALLGFFEANPQFLTEGRNLIQDADYLFPHYVAGFLPAGIGGLVVAAMFAAAMSSLDSGINSIVTVFCRDLLPHVRRRGGNGHDEIKLARYLVLGIGVAIVLISSEMGKVPGNIFEVTNKTDGLFVGPLFGLFVLALFVPGANAFGASFGALYGFLSALLIAYWDLFTGLEGLSFQWIIAVSLAVHLVVGVVLSWLSRRWPVGQPARIAGVALATAPSVVLIAWLIAGCPP